MYESREDDLEEVEESGETEDFLEPEEPEESDDPSSVDGGSGGRSGEESLPEEDEEAALLQSTRVALKDESVQDSGELGNYWLWLGILLFIVASGWLSKDRGQDVPLAIAVVVGVLLLHEAGHYFAMRFFGYRDPRIFFIPFLGVLTVGEKQVAPAWQKAVVILMGPLPGVVLGGSLYLGMHPTQGSPLHMTLVILLLINLFNLFPLVPLDGGRLLQLVMFSRHPLLESGFALLGGLGLIGLGLALEDWIPAFFGVMGLLNVPSKYREARARAAIPENLRGFPVALEEMDDDVFQSFLQLTRKITPGLCHPQSCARSMRRLHEFLSIHRPSLAMTGGFVLLYVAVGILGVMTFLGVLTQDHRNEQAAAQALLQELYEQEAEVDRCRDAPQTALQKHGDPPDTLAGCKEIAGLAEEWHGAVHKLLSMWQDAKPGLQGLPGGGEAPVAEMIRTLEELEQGSRKVVSTLHELVEQME